VTIGSRRVEEHKVTDVVQEQPVRRRPTERDGHPCNRRDNAPLPDHTGIDLGALRDRVDHHALESVLATLLVRAHRADGGRTAYHEDSPGVDL
jgi:hypothetical protein